MKITQQIGRLVVIVYWASYLLWYITEIEIKLKPTCKQFSNKLFQPRNSTKLIPLDSFV